MHVHEFQAIVSLSTLLANHIKENVTWFYNSNNNADGYYSEEDYQEALAKCTMERTIKKFVIYNVLTFGLDAPLSLTLLSAANGHRSRWWKVILRTWLHSFRDGNFTRKDYRIAVVVCSWRLTRFCWMGEFQHA